MMGLYTGTKYRMGHMGYVVMAAQSGLRVLPTRIIDPDPQSNVVTHAGIAPLPAWAVNDNVQPLEGAGAYKDLAEIPRRREYNITTSIQVQSGTFLKKAVRNIASPPAAHVLGLEAFAMEIGVMSNYADEAYAVQGLDCLFNTLTFNIAEMQFLTADVDLWPSVLVNATPQVQAAVGFPDAGIPQGVLRWEQITWNVAGTDYKPLIQNIRLNFANNLRRQGMRAILLGGGGTEYNISRTAFKTLPGMEKLTLAYSLYDTPPAALREPYNWGTVQGLASDGGSNICRVTIDHHYASNFRQQQTAANEPVMYTMDIAAIGITIADS